MNQQAGSDLELTLQRAVERPYPDASVDVHPQPDGAEVTISGVALRGEATGPGSGEHVMLRMSDDGPLKRYLLTGRVN